MPKTDGLKEEIGWLKIVFGIAIAIDVSLVGWVAQNFGKTQPVVVVFALLGVAAITGFVVWVNRLAYQRIRELEKL
jgi:predicted MFS family arabinose efflux permease